MPEFGISGTSSGFGAGLKRILAGVTLNRTNLGKYKSLNYNTIIHAGFERFDNSKNANRYQADAIDLAETLLDLNYNRFIFISTVECNNLDLKTPYVTAKRSIEELVQSKCENFLILRLPSLFGYEMQRNQINRIATEKTPTLSLSGGSTFSLLQYEDVAQFIQRNENLIGLKTIAAECLSLEEIALYFRNTPVWGDYKYTTILPKNISHLYDKATQIQKYKEFISEFQHN